MLFSESFCEPLFLEFLRVAGDKIVQLEETPLDVSVYSCSDAVQMTLLVMPMALFFCLDLISIGNSVE